MLQKEDGMPPLTVTQFNGLHLKTDTLDNTDKNSVFPLFEDESLFLASEIKTNSTEKILDIGTGSGILAISAAKQGAYVTATDINPRALKLTTLNARINNVQSHIKTINADGLETITGQFDQILFNPPFNAVPPNKNGKIYTAGGKFGTDLIERTLSRLEKNLSKNAVLKMVSISLGKNNKPLVVDIIQNQCAARSPAITLQNLYPPLDHVNFDYYKKVFGQIPEEWYQAVCGFPQLYYLYITVNFDASESSVTQKPDMTFKETEFSGNWDARIRRLQHTMNVQTRHQ